MRRHLIVLAVVGLFGFAASEASACHMKKRCHKPACAPAPCAVVEPCPPPPPPVCEPVTCAPRKKCCFKMPKMHMPKFSLCHKKPACEPAPCEYAAPVAAYAAPQYASPQGYASPQVMPSGQ